MNIGDRVRHIYSKKAFGKIVSIPDTGLCAGRIQVQWDFGPCYFHAPKFLVDPNAGDESLNDTDLATAEAIEVIESLSDYGEADAAEEIYQIDSAIIEEAAFD
jgi:hypothetical protein